MLNKSQVDAVPIALIKEKLTRLEAEENVRILLAVESGSRAWGFASTDSDFDVRFLYVRPRDWYLTIDEGRDVIERPIDSDDIDVGGWDLRKALRLFRKSNPPLLEWLQSTIVYVERFGAAHALRDLMPDLYSPATCLYHYLHMARGTYQDYLRGESVKLKKYFYALRPVLACAWIDAGYGVAPIEFQRLLDRLLPSGPVRDEVDALLIKKGSGAELDSGPRIPVLHEYLESEIQRIENSNNNTGARLKDAGALNRLFRSAIEEAWQR